MVINKPSGMGVDEVGQWLKSNFRTAVLAHRLDKPTSGLLLAAPTPRALANLQSQFKKRLVKKEYLALAHGAVKEDSGIITAPVKRSPFNPLKFAANPSGRASQTEYKVLERLAIPKEYLSPSFRKSKDPLLTIVTLVRVAPRTGRTHQIRVHLKYLGHPLVGDAVYTGKKMLKNDALWCPRLFLHAARITVKHPRTGRILDFKSPLPLTLERVLTLLYNGKVVGSEGG